MNAHLQKRLNDLPAFPGVYLMKDERGKIIYIGKARQLNRRVRSYFMGREHEGHRAATLMVAKIADIEWIITESEEEALVLEATLVRKNWPRYNVRLKDDKHFPYLMLTKEDFPRVLVVRQVRKDGNQYFGPYLNARSLRTLLDLLPRLFRIRECDLKLPLKEPIRPCLAAHIGRCDAPCAEKCSKQQYALGVQEAVRLLDGRRDDLLQNWEQEMQNAALNREYELAARLRDRIAALNSTFTRTKTDVSDAGLELDAISVARDGTAACVVLLQYRAGILTERQHYRLECALEQGESEILMEFLPALYVQTKNIPREICLDFSPTESELLETALSSIAEHRVLLHQPKRGNKIGFLQLARANAEMLLVEMQARQQKYDSMDRAIFDLQKELDLPYPPYKIECFDISHLGGTGTVASMVHFHNGHPQKSQYRHYHVKSVQGIDDFASMREIVGRRLRRLLEEGREMPNLLVIDGGKGQVEATWAVVKSLGLADIPVIGLAKRMEEIVFPGRCETLLLKRNSLALKLLQRARDEAHRFAITHQRKLRRQDLEVQWLRSIPGLGPQTKQKILKQFKSPAAVLQASTETLDQLLGPHKAKALRKALNLATPYPEAGESA